MSSWSSTINTRPIALPRSALRGPSDHRISPKRARAEDIRRSPQTSADAPAARERKMAPVGPESHLKVPEKARAVNKAAHFPAHFHDLAELARRLAELPADVRARLLGGLNAGQS
jgi:hypothetical protein